MLNDVVNDPFSLDTVEDVRPLLSFVMFVNCSYEVSPEIKTVVSLQYVTVFWYSRFTLMNSWLFYLT